ncbi:MAG: hypothetical protein JWP91_3330 [Fibrobacteres bacterium]|nr:hypothetical protein [Fibrobacterota bacterium]
MKIPISLIPLLLLSVMKIHSQTAQVWVPPGATASPYHVRYAVYDLRNSPARVQFRLEENKVDYFYPFNASDPLQVSKANTVFATLMTSKTTGEGVYIFVVDTQNNIGAVQLGPN